MTSEAEQALQSAILNVLHEKGLLRDGETLGDFIVMAELPSFSDSSLNTRYANILPPGDAIPLHRIVGLIEVCSEIGMGDDE